PAADLNEIPKIDRGALRGHRYGHITDTCCAIEFSRRGENHSALACFHASTRSDDVAGREHFGEISRTEAVGSETILRVIEIDGLRQNTQPLHLGNFGSSLERTADQVR